MITSNQFAVASVSLGKPEGGHKIENVLSAAAKQNIPGIEMVHEHLAEYAWRVQGDSGEASVLKAAKNVGGICTLLGLKIIALQPFVMYEGRTWQHLHRHQYDLHLKQSLGVPLRTFGSKAGGL